MFFIKKEDKGREKKEIQDPIHDATQHVPMC